MGWRESASQKIGCDDQGANLFRDYPHFFATTHTTFSTTKRAATFSEEFAAVQLPSSRL